MAISAPRIRRSSSRPMASMSRPWYRISPLTTRPALPRWRITASAMVDLPHPDLGELHLAGRMWLVAVHLAGGEDVDWAPQRFDHDCSVLQDLLDLFHLGLARGHVDRRLGVRQRLVELRIGEMALVPWHAGA